MPKLTKKKYLPKEFEHVYLGMSLDELQNIKKHNSLKIKTSSFVSYATEMVNNQFVESYIYQFDRHRLLYEIIIQYKPELDVEKYLLDNFGKLIQDNELLIQVTNSLYLKIWTYHNRIRIANAAYFTDELTAHEAA
ncbi:MAG: hypothetical protein NW226_24490 [Microscillaceae bacterium]|nr:hypothetical protein [Microscillaceae bacterium]